MPRIKTKLRSGGAFFFSGEEIRNVSDFPAAAPNYMLWNWRNARASLEGSTIMSLPAKLLEALGNLAMLALLLLAIANIVVVTGTVGAALFANAESAVTHRFEFQFMG